MEKDGKKQGHVDDLPQEVFRRPKVKESDWGFTSSLVVFGSLVAGAWLLLSEDFLSGLFTGSGFALYFLIFIWFLFLAKLMSGSKKRGPRYLEVIHSRAEEVTLRKRPGCAIFVQLKISSPIAGRTMQLLVEFKDERGLLHQSSLRAYRGEFGEVLARKEVQLPKPRDDRYPYAEAGAFVPLRAFVLQPGQRDLRIKPIITYKIKSHIIDTTVLPYEVFDTKALASLSADAVIAKIELAAAICQICGYPMNDDAVVCQTCETPHHKECWEYIGGCSTYGCEGRPVSSEDD